MTDHPNKTAILFFANTPVEDARLKRMKGGTPVFSRLNNTFLKFLSQSTLPYFHLSEKEQSGNTFGERLGNAIADIFKQDYESVLVLGNDTPGLSPALLLRAYKALEDGKSVVGPSADGGCYLFGIRKLGFNHKKFTSLSWKTPDLCRQLLVILETSGNGAVRFPVLWDIDSQYDIPLVLSETYGMDPILKQLLHLLLSRPAPLFHHSEIMFSAAQSDFPYNKGSPALH